MERNIRIAFEISARGLPLPTDHPVELGAPEVTPLASALGVPIG